MQEKKIYETRIHEYKIEYQLYAYGWWQLFWI